MKIINRDSNWKVNNIQRMIDFKLWLHGKDTLKMYRESIKCPNSTTKEIVAEPEMEYHNEGMDMGEYYDLDNFIGRRNINKNTGGKNAKEK